MGARQIQEPAAVAKVLAGRGAAGALPRTHHFVEARNLQKGEGFVRLIRLGEVGHGAVEPQGFLRGNQFQQGQGLVPAHPVAAHAGVDFEVDGNALAGGGGQAGQLVDGVRLVDTDRQVMLDAPGQFRLLPFAQKQQGGGDAGVAQGHGFFQSAQAEARRAFFQGDLHHVQGAVAVGFVLDHGEQFDGGWKFAADEAQVLAEAGQVNLDPGRPQRKSCGMKVHQ